MRRIATRGGARWRCLKCLEETGRRFPKNNKPERQVIQVAWVGSLWWEAKPLRRVKDRLGRSLIASLMLHAVLISLQFGSQGFGLPWFQKTFDETPHPVAAIHAILSLPQPKTEREAQWTRQPSTEPVLARDGKTSASLRKSSAMATSADTKDTKKPGRTPYSSNTKSKTSISPTSINGAKVLATDHQSPWQMPVAQEVQEGEERVRITPTPADQTVRTEVVDAKPTSEALENATEPPNAAKASAAAIESKRADELARIEAAKAERAEQDAATNVLQEALEHQQAGERRQAETRLRRETEQKMAEQVAVAKAKQEAIERQRAEAQLQIDSKIEAEKKKVEQEFLERKGAEERAQRTRIEGERKQAEQAALAKASQEALDKKQRALDLERRSLAAFGNDAQNGPVKLNERGSNQATQPLDRPANALPVNPFKDSSDAAQRRKASLVGPDPKNIQLAFYGEGWRQKIERIGSVNYPKIDKEHHYDTLLVTVTINSDGTLAGVRIDKSSGQRETDDAVRRIVEMSAPFAAFPPDMKRNYDQVDITRTWVFDHGTRIKTP